MKTIIVDPLGEARRAQYKVAPRVADLNGKVLGMFDNSKPNFNIFLDRLEEQLRARYALAGVVRMGKETAKRGAPAATLSKLAREADLIINGMGD